VKETMRMLGRSERIDGLPFRAFRVRHPSHALTMVETGMGVENAARVLLHLLQTDRPDAVISLGYCGALSPDASVGDVIWASSVCLIEGQKIETLSLPDNGELFEKLSLRFPVRAGTFITMKEWMKKGDIVPFMKPEMMLPVCDMETFGLARLCHSNKLSFLALRAVSDGADTDLLFDPWSVCDRSGIYSAARAMRLFLTRPHLISHAIELYRNSKIASSNLAQAVSALIWLMADSS
jgi:adenosylhomocysteine nucleosidase